MKKLIILLVLCLALITMNFGQNTSIDLTFTSLSDTVWVKTDSIKVVNRSQGCDTVLYWNDTVLVINLPVGLSEIGGRRSFDLESYPNPVADRALIELSLYAPGQCVMNVTDVSGRALFTMDRPLPAGKHNFQIVPGNSRLYFITISWNGYRETIKMVNTNTTNNKQCMLTYLGYDAGIVAHKAFMPSQGFVFLPGDELLFIAYKDTLESGLLDSPEVNAAYTFQFAFNIPCPGMPTVAYGGKVYNTVQIFSQCWLKENLDVGTMIDGTVEMTDNGVLEKYCYYNDTNRCTQYGGLYQWDEMMAYSSQPGERGICPLGWHIPSDEDWKIMEGAVDSQYGIGDPIWNQYGLRGYNAGTNLKSTNGWSGNGNGSGLYGFSGLPGGYRFSDGNFYYKNMHSLWWSSTEGNTTSAWNRYLSYNNPIVDRDYGNNKGFGFNIRCIKD